MRRSLWIVVLLACLAVPAVGKAQSQTAAPEPAKTPDIAPEAAAPVAAMCRDLASRSALAFSAEITEEQVYPNGQTVQLTRFADVALKRPDKLYSRVTGDERDRVFVYDGKTVTVADYDRGVYAVIDAPPTIDATMAMLSEKYGLVAPLSDLLYADPCKELLANVRTGDCVGVHTAAGVACDHLAFTQKKRRLAALGGKGQVGPAAKGRHYRQKRHGLAAIRRHLHGLGHRSAPAGRPLYLQARQGLAPHRIHPHDRRPGRQVRQWP
ncbi:Outer membrane protein [Desulfovibrio sp. DV]|nr:Outer membrane protein [Desulfovibrio sp. DV]